MKIRTIYIAGPMTGKPGFNYQKFNEWARALRALGWGVKNPVEIGERFGTADEINADKKLLETVMAAEIEELKKCDAIFLLDEWETSTGAKKELAVALSQGLEVIVAPKLI